MDRIEQRGVDLKNALDFFWEVVEGSDLQEVLDAQGGLGLGSRIHGLVAAGWRVEPPGTPHPAYEGFVGANDYPIPRDDIEFEQFRAEEDGPHEMSGIFLCHKPSESHLYTWGPGSALVKKPYLLSCLRKHLMTNGPTAYVEIRERMPER